MPTYQVKFLALTDMVGYAPVEADTPEQAVEIAKETWLDHNLSWEFVDIREPLQDTAVPISVWTEGMEEELLELEGDPFSHKIEADKALVEQVLKQRHPDGSGS